MIIRLGSNYIPITEITRYEIREDKRLRIYLKEKIGPFRKYITTAAFANFDAAKDWIYKNDLKSIP